MNKVFMQEALALAEQALRLGEVPVGAVVVKAGTIIGRGFNCRETDNDPTAHAEMVALREAARSLNAWRLTGTELYVTLEPCPMCAGALVNARVQTLVFGAHDPKAGACTSLWNLVQDPRAVHRLEVYDGICAQECSRLLSRFFSGLRN